MSFSSASQEEMFPGALQKKIYPINTHYITCIIMELLIEGPPFFKEFSHHFPYEKKMLTCQQQVWPPAHHLVHCWDSPCDTRQPQYRKLPASQNRLFFWGCLSVKTSSSTNLFQSSTHVFVCKKKLLPKVSNFTHPTEILGNTSQQLDGHAIGFPRPGDVGVRIGVS